MGDTTSEPVGRAPAVDEIAGRELMCRDLLDGPFDISGFAWLERDRAYCRFPVDQLPEFRTGLQGGAWQTAGGMARFRTDSGTMAIMVHLRGDVHMNHMPRTGNSGFDLYLGVGKDKRFLSIARPPAKGTEYEAMLIDGSPEGMREWTLNFPLYNGVERVQVGIDPKARLEAPSPFAIEKPLLFYGSSITQGGCASRPGNSYTHIIARWLDANMVNLGFSGNAKGDAAVAELIASMDLSVFVMDYDHNAESPEQLEETHEPFYRIIRETQPNLPVVIVSSPAFDANPAARAERRAVIRRTYENALKGGDRRVFFVDGQTLFGTRDRDACTVDGCHPNDLGFMRMAETIRPAVEAALKVAQT